MFRLRPKTRTGAPPGCEEPRRLAAVGCDARPEAKGTEGSAWRRAVLRFSGLWDEPDGRGE